VREYFNFAWRSFYLVNLDVGFDVTSQLADGPRGNIFLRDAALISCHVEAKYQFWEKGGRPVDF